MDKWLIKECDISAAAQLSAETELTPLVSHILVSRDIVSRASAIDFFNSFDIADPFLMADMDLAVELINEAVENSEKITVYGDYDCDGVTSTVMLYTYLQTLGANVSWHIPSRNDGYGLNIVAVNEIAANGTKLIITVDNGISATTEAEYIRDLGLKLIITDHHQPPEELPVANAIINPHRKDDFSEYKYLAGCGVVLKLIIALEGEADSIFEQYADLAALGTIADIVPLTGENRHIVKRGLENIMYSENAGLVALLEQCKITEERLSASALAFTVCPRINAAGRFTNATLAVELLLCEDLEDAKELAKELSELNAARQEIEKQITKQIEEQLILSEGGFNERVIISFGTNWHHGVIGIVSARLLSKYGKPVLVMAIDGKIARGSARSIDGFSLYKLLDHCSDLLVKFGGHTKAAGFTIETEKIPLFIKRINNYAKENFLVMPSPTIIVDKELDIDDLSIENVEQLDVLQPFGEKNTLPLFLMRNCKILSSKSIKDGKYVSFAINFKGEEFRVISFAKNFEQFWYKNNSCIDMLVNLEINNFNNKKTVSIRAKEIRISGISEDKYFAAKNAYEKLKTGESVDKRLIKRIIPTKDDMKKAYDIIRQSSMISEVIEKACVLDINYCMLMVIIDVLLEFKLIKLDFMYDKISIVPSTEKADFSKSAVLKNLMEQIEKGAE